jgi:hypothetical protein
VDEREAKLVLLDELERYRGLSHAELVPRVGCSEQVIRTGDSGSEYQIEMSIRWDAKAQGVIRVVGSIDDGRGLRGFVPMSESILVKP